MKKEDINNLGLRTQHKSPSPKSHRTLISKVKGLVTALGGYPTDQLILIFNAVLSNLNREVAYMPASDESFQYLEGMKDTHTVVATEVRAILTLAVAPALKVAGREKQRELGVFDYVWKRADQISAQLKAGDLSFFRNEKRRRKSRVLKSDLPHLAVKFLDECSEPVKFSTTGMRVLKYSMRRIFRLFQEEYADEIEQSGGITKNTLCSYRLKRHLDQKSASLYNCPIHVLAQDALKSAKSFMAREHVPGHCNANGCTKCTLIESFPETTHGFVNDKFRACRPRNPNVECLANECKTCFMEPDLWIEQQMTEAGFDLSDEHFANVEPLTYATFGSRFDNGFKVTELMFLRDKSVPEVLAEWSSCLSKLPSHQHDQWRVSEVIKSLTADDDPTLPETASLAHIDYQENIECWQAQMVPTQRFGRKKFAAFTQVIDARWENIKPERFQRPELLQKVDFQNNICRIAVSHFCKDSTKHNAETGVQSLEILIDDMLSFTKELNSVILTSDGSPKEFLNPHFLALLAELSAKKSEQLGRVLTIGVVYYASYHGSTPCDAEQRVVKSLNESLGPNNKNFDSGIDNLVKATNAPAGQPDREGKTFRRMATLVPGIETHPSPYKSLSKTRDFKYYWSYGQKNEMKRRRYPCLEQCCDIDDQSDECQFKDRFGSIETVIFEVDLKKKVQNQSRSSKRAAANKENAPPAKRRSPNQPGRRQGRGRKRARL